MKRPHGWCLLLCVVAGCSTAPLTDFCDIVRPGKIGPNKVQPYGGVAIPQGPIVPVAPAVIVGPPAPLPPGGAVPPPAFPGPGNPGFQLQPPNTDIPPLPPDPPRRFGN